jgi:hypothetical protein
MTERLSIPQVLDGVISADDIAPLVQLVEQHKNWGSFTARIPSYIIVSLVDTLRVLREHGARYYITSDGRPTTLEDDGEPSDEEIESAYSDELHDEDA